MAERYVTVTTALDFAQEPIVLERCSVNELHHDEGWVELNRADIRARFRIVT